MMNADLIGFIALLIVVVVVFLIVMFGVDDL